MTQQEYDNLRVGDKISYKAEKCGEYWWWNIATVKGKAKALPNLEFSMQIRRH